MLGMAYHFSAKSTASGRPEDRTLKLHWDEQNTNESP